MELETLRRLPEPENKAELVERMDIAYRAAEGLIEELSEEEMTRPLSEEGWSVKDFLAHMMVWERGIVALLRKEPRYEAMGLRMEEVLGVEGYDVLNEMLYRQNKDRPFTEVIAGLRQTHEELLEVLAGLDEADLRRGYSHYQPQEPGEESGRPIISWVAGNTYDHYAEHVGYVWGRIDKS